MRPLSSLHFLLLLTFGFLSSVLANAGANPYRVLGVSETASQEEIKRNYRTLCLKYHPDKNTQRSTSERLSVETKFKQLQEAYSQIGTAEARRLFELRQSSPFPSSFSSQGQNPYSNLHQDDLFAQAFRSYASQSRQNSSFRFYTTRTTPSGRNQDGNMLWSSLKSIYEQRVKISLYDLYNGKSKVKFRLRDNIWAHCLAAFRGGIGYAILYQSFLFVIPVWRMTNRWIALAIALCVFYQQLPKPFDTDQFEATIQPGYKAGTRLTFQPTSDPRIQVVFILEEEKHPKYRRIGNDLHVDVKLSRTEAKRGCQLFIETLCASESSIEIVLEPDSVRNTGQTLVIKGQGWPCRKTGKFGDLVLHFTVVKSKRNKPVWR